MDASVVFDESMAIYDLGEGHPLSPVRVRLAVELMSAYGLLDAPGVLVPPAPAPDDVLTLVHAKEYVEAVKAAGERPGDAFLPRFGIGTSDNPAFPRMHEAGALVAGASVEAMRLVLSEERRRVFSPGGGLHHAHRSRAAGFCVYNDPAVAIAWALRERPGLRMLYVDIDAHHGDGVQEAFWEDPRVMTVSLHESGRYLFPGTGFSEEVGAGEGLGFAANVPLPPYAVDACWTLAFERLVEPLARAFRPDLVVTQNGVDAHRLDPITHLEMTVPGHRALTRRLRALAEELAGGRLVALGGGGYEWYSVVPRAWTALAADLLDAAVPDAVPEEWQRLSSAASGEKAPGTLMEDAPSEAESESERLLAETGRAIERTTEILGRYHTL